MNIHDQLQQQRAYFNSGATKPYAFRKEQLEKLKKAIKQYEAFTPDQLTDYLSAVYTQVKSKHSDLIEYDVERFSDIPTEDYIQTFLDAPKEALDLVTKQVEKEPSGS